MYKDEIVMSYTRKAAKTLCSSLVFQNKQKTDPSVMKVNMLGQNAYWFTIKTQTPKQ